MPIHALRLATLAAASAALLAAGGCASRGETTPATPQPVTTTTSQSTTTSGASTTTTTKTVTAGPAPVKVKSRNGKWEGEMIGVPASGSRFAKLQIGMEFNEVTALIGGAGAMTTHETGKRWIPFYFGNDVRRMEVQYPGEGCLTFTAGNVWGGGGNELVRITADPSGALCRE